MNQLVIGMGQIGSAVQSILGCDGVDKELSSPKHYDVIHVAIPYTPDFNFHMQEFIRLYTPDLIVIHSTVAPGTCERFNAVHSPARGRHPNLEPGIRTFVKFFGGEKAEQAANLFREKGITCVTTPKSITTELAKLFDTTQYGLQILMQKRIKEACDKYGADFDVVYTEANRTYNEGYAKLGEPQFCRPVLKHFDGPVGGHCIQSNATILHQNGIEFDELEDLMSLGQVVNGEPQADRTWLYCEYWGKKKSTIQIAKELGLSDVAIQKRMKNFGIPLRRREWTAEEDAQLIELAKTNTFAECARIMNKTHSALRTRAILLGIKSVYAPGEETQKEDVRKKISATLQGISLTEWDGYVETENDRQRNSEEYKKWRTSVFERDGYRCVNGCDSSPLNADHIKPWALFEELRFDIDNGQTLCVPCHKEKTLRDMDEITKARLYGTRKRSNSS